MARGRKRDANAISVTVRPNTDGVKKQKTAPTKSGYTSRKKYYAKVNGQSKTRTCDLVFSALLDTPVARNTIVGTAVPGNDILTNQPMGRDQMFGMYEKCYVKSAVQDINVGMIVPTHDQGGNTGSFIVNHWVDNNSNNSASLAESTQRCLSHDGNHIIKEWVKEDYDFGYTPSITSNMIHSKISGGTKSITHRGFDDPDLAQTSANPPTTLWYFHCEVYADDSASVQTFSDTPIEKVTTFNCVFFDPKELAVS